MSSDAKPPPRKPSSGSQESSPAGVNNVQNDSTVNSSIPPEEPSNTHELPSKTDSRRSEVTQHFSAFMDNLQTRALSASHTLNDLTGYTGIEAIKASNESLESAHSKAQTNLRAARTNYKATSARQAASQREVTTLLARKDSWMPADLERFTQLYRADHVLEQEVAAAAKALTEAEDEEQRLGTKLNAGILRRYHEEQIWSDRIRRASTWGTWGLMGVNVLLFLVLQFVAEPWKRKRLVKGVVEEEKVVLEEVRNQLSEVKLALEQAASRKPTVGGTIAATQDAVPPASTIAAASNTDAPPNYTWGELLSSPALMRGAAKDLYSERRTDLRMKDLSLLVFEGAFAGATMAAGLTFLFLRYN
jgi:sensitive to high expression protein 9, mitochondrial